MEFFTLLRLAFLHDIHGASLEEVPTANHDTSHKHSHQTPTAQNGEHAQDRVLRPMNVHHLFDLVSDLAEDIRYFGKDLSVGQLHLMVFGHV